MRLGLTVGLRSTVLALSQRTVLRQCYAIRGTELAYRATHSRTARYCFGTCPPHTPRIASVPPYPTSVPHVA
eukprot:3743906-Rhodomonas_salina.2